MQKRVHDYVVADKGTAQEALDALVKDWKKVFKEDGKIQSERVRGSPGLSEIPGGTAAVIVPEP